MNFLKNLFIPKQPAIPQLKTNDQRLWGPWVVAMKNVQDRTQEGGGGAIQFINYDYLMIAYISVISNPNDKTARSVKFEKPKKDAKGSWNLKATVRHPGYVFVAAVSRHTTQQLSFESY